MRVLVTGASRGLGLSLCRHLSRRGDAALAVCRRASPELLALRGVVVLDGVDLSRPDAATRIEAGVGGEALDVVICNAAINESFAATSADVDVAMLERELQVNALGPVRTVRAAVGHLAAGARIALISSGIVSREGPGRRTPAQYGYKMSKAALNEFGVALANELAHRGVAVLMLDPGPMDTEMLRTVFDAGATAFDPRRDGQAPDLVAAALLQRIDATTLEHTGHWFSVAGAELAI